MKLWSYKNSVSGKILALATTVSMVGILGGSTVLLFLDYRTARSALINKSLVTTRMVANYCVAPLLFYDPEGATEILATMGAEAGVMAARIANSDGEQFAVYSDPKTNEDRFIEGVCTPENQIRSKTEGDNQVAIFETDLLLALDAAIVHKGKVHGYLRVFFSKNELHQQAMAGLLVAAIVVLVSIGVCVLLAVRLQRLITEPFHRLVSTMASVTGGAGLKERVEVTSRDEVGALGHGFNKMMESITRHNQARQRSEARLRALLRTMPDLIFVVTEDGYYREILSGPKELFVLPPEQLLQKNIKDILTPELAERCLAVISHAMRTDSKQLLEYELDVEAGKRHFEALAVPVSPAEADHRSDERLVLWIARDVTERKQAEAERERLQAQLTQAQKMESVGRLAGGVAHDFNNMLGVILGYSETILEQLEPQHPIYAFSKQIAKAAERSADLTSQLLAFARKQTVAPKVIDLNETVSGMLKMLYRLIGEDIDLVWRPFKELWPILVDTSQIDQILVNLCVNSRDAIEGVGKITIETDNASLEEEYCAQHLDFTPGDYVMLSVSDDGHGLDQETQTKLFEPFFTTKKLGEGTGLGLATVYGIVKQNKGFINVHSGPGKGTSIKIYLPRHAGKSEHLFETTNAAETVKGKETILLVEDESSILNLTTMLLKKQGYAVIAARSPGEALRLAREHAGLIDLLMTDVVMPEMNGRELAENLMSIHSDIKHLFMSGYTENIIAHHGVLDAGVNFIQKPFSKKALIATVRDVLDKT